MRRTSSSPRRSERAGPTPTRVACLAYVLLAAMVAAGGGAIVKGDIETPDSGLEAEVRLRDTVVELRAEGILAGTPARAPAAAVVSVEIGHGKFSPRVVAIAAGAAVEFVNRDEHFHNVAATSVKKVDLGMTAPGEHARVVFDAPGVTRVFCKAEPPMEGFVVVLDTPYFAVPGVNGDYVIRDLRPGSYVARAWNPHYEPVAQRFALTRDDEVLTVDLRFQRRRLFTGP